jgi:hypothetical protein
MPNADIAIRINDAVCTPNNETNPAKYPWDIEREIKYIAFGPMLELMANAIIVYSKISDLSKTIFTYNKKGLGKSQGLLKNLT